MFQLAVVSSMDEIVSLRLIQIRPISCITKGDGLDVEHAVVTEDSLDSPCSVILYPKLIEETLRKPFNAAQISKCPIIIKDASIKR